MLSEVAIAADREWLDLSLAQQAVWLDAKLSGSAAYQLGGWARIAAPLDEEAVRQSVSLLMARHDALRLRVDDEMPRQWLDESVVPPLIAVDLAVTQDPDEAFRGHVEKVFSSALPLGDSPLFRIELIRAGRNLNYLLWRFHHLIADSASVSIALGHWFNSYEALTSGTPRELAPGSSYIKTITSDAAYLKSAAYHKDLAYWSNRFEPLPPPLLSNLEPRVNGQRTVPPVKWLLDGESLQHFQTAAEAAGTTVQRALFALFALVLGRRYGQSDLVSGVALHRRDIASRHTLGMLAGVIPVRWQFDSFWSLEEAVQSFSEQVDADLRHQRLPVDILSRALGLSGSGRAGLFEVAMSYLPSHRGQSASLIDGLPVTTGVVDTNEASPISLHVGELHSGGGVNISLAVNTDFLDAAESQKLASLFQAALCRFVMEPQSRVATLEQLPSSEHSLVVDEWNRTETVFNNGTLDELFSAQARRTPQAVAIIGCDGRELTYAALDDESSRLARQLMANGVRREHVVGVRMERSAETIIAFLAILKAGGVYLPLDPAYPADRLAYMASDAGATLVLDSINGLKGEGEVPHHRDPNDLAYIIYTSGTTGLPKGVAVRHAAPVNMAFARRACHDPLGPGDRVLAAISVGFDVSIGQLLLPLLSGAAVVIAADLKTLDAAEFWAFLAERRITHINSVPSFFDSILDSAPSTGTLALKRLMLGGEALSGALLGRIKRALPAVEVVNMYGPTEACIDATFHVATPADLSAAVLPIGKPLSNYQAYVLNDALEPVGVGVTGELYLGGAGLASGYVNAPELTAERFVANPFSRTPGARIYSTGDLARWRSDGRLEFLGRGDQQVKIRGFRVEPGEIAAALMSHSSVGQTVVVSKSSRLVAYFVPRAGCAIPEPADLRGFLACRLPDYMVPSAFVSIAAIPLNRNGKLDEKQLPSPDLSAGEHVPPRTPTEQRVARLFAEVLGLGQCGATAHFFELGGHSLLATTLVSKLRDLGITVALRSIFETPTVETLARRIDNSLPTDSSSQSIAAQPRSGDLPLSFPQERIWFVDRLQGDSSHNIPIAFELRGKLDAAAAKQAIEEIVARHEILRTRIVLRDGKPVQDVLPALSLTFPFTDLSSLDEESKAAALRELLLKLAKYRFDLAADLPFQVQLIALSTDRHVLASVIHHAAFDGWSAGIFLGEFTALYSALVEKRPHPLPSLKIQYADFAIWQRQQNWDADLAFWLEELQGAPANLELPVRHSEIANSTRLAGTLPFTVDAGLRAALTKLARENGASLFMVLHAAYGLLLARWSQQDDLVIGTVTANRQRSELEPMIGCFVNTLPLRTRLRSDESFADLLRRVKDGDLAAFAHQDLPFEQLVDALHPERSLQNAPIVQVMLVLQNTPLPEAQLPGLVLTPIVVEAETAKFDLTLTFTDHAHALAGSIEFAANRFDRALIERFAAQYLALLQAVVADPAQRTSEIQLLDASERALVLGKWGGTATPFPRGTLDGLFATQVKRTPDAIAIVGSDGTELTYQQLDERSNRVARYLVSQGVGLEDVVGVRIERSSETIIAFLGILKAGGVYLPLDPAYPPDRLAYMAAHAGAVLVLDSLDGLDAAVELPSLADPSRLAYIIYTSGSTGQPKGVAMAHAAAVNLAFARRACHDPLAAGDRVMAVTSVGFDVSVGQFLFPLLCGATVVIAGDIKTIGGRGFWELLERERVTHLNFVPSYVDSILDALPPTHQIVLKRLMLGGEPLSATLVARLQRALPGLEVVNMYGPTEACIDATFHVASPADSSLAILPIGRPLSNYRAYILDRWLEPVGVGVFGELYLSGLGLARGYVNAPELTAERFLADPFSATPGARMYRTGDRACWRADGCIEFLGRLDQQVKIRGFRVEPGEVEAQLRQLPGIREAAVIAQKTAGDTRLIAYYVGEEYTDPAALHKDMAALLPHYMVPAAFIRLAALPLSPNGKLDHKALPEPDAHAFVSRVYEPPQGDVEERMAALWAEVLQRGKVGRHDNFFELGGHSLLAVSLIERMQQLGLPADIRALFTTPTIAGLALSSSSFALLPDVPPNGILPGCTNITPNMLHLAALSQTQIDGVVASVPGGAANVQDIYPLAPLQEGILFQHWMTQQGDPYLSPALLAFAGRDYLDSFLQALNQLVERHDVLRTAFVWKNVDAPLQIVLRQVELPVEELSSPASAEQLLARFDPRIYRLDLSKAPLLRAIVAHDPDRGRWLLLLLAHHLILDHTSMEIVVHELRTLMADPESALPAALPYRNFIAATRGGATPEEQQAFFTHMLADIEEPTAPFGLLDVQAATGETVEERLPLDSALSQRIRERARVLSVTPASLFHTAWAAVLAKVAGKPNVVFGTVLFGRMRSGAGAGRAVGMLINTLPVRLDVDDTGVSESVLRTHRLLAQLMEHEHAPLALAQRCSAVPPPAPLFSSLFNYRYSPAEQSNATWPGVEMVAAAERTNYPLAMAVDDSGSGFLLTALAHPLAAPARVCQYLQQALSELVDSLEHEPQRALASLAVLPATERRQVVEQWNQTDTKFASGTLDNLFAAQARRTPNAVAVIGRDGAELTYADLDAHSTQLARQLVAQGVRPESVVGVRMQRSAETVIAFLAILKAGGVYLPLDPAYPADRLDYIAKDAGALLVLDSIHGLSGEADLPQLADPNRLAYIIYTSGTTGRPKGVAVSHVPPVNLAFARRACHDPIGPGDRILAAISVGFDVSIGQLLLPLLSGAAVVIADDLKTMGATAFWAFLAERRVTHVNSVPSFLDSILDSAPAAASLALKRLMLGGETLSGALAARIQRTLPAVEVVNMYGPTEACIDATYHVVTQADFESPVIPIGRPLSNYRAYVLDYRKQPAGVGITGELYLGGAGLARGYVNAHGLTAERFVDDPFSQIPGAKLYRTGDRARWRADGEIEFIGRVDEQVKIRGFRVEPGEVEMQLRRQPGVREAAVVPQVTPGGTRLIAYYTSGEDPHLDTLRAGMAAVLPDYMVPAAFVKLDKLPLSPNGKLDRKALPEASQGAFVARAFEPPVGEVESKMATLWAQLLKREQVGRHDNFFELGGHSLLAMTLIERMQQQGLPGDVRTLFTTPTIAGLAASADETPLRIAAPENGILPGCAQITPAMLPLIELTQTQIDRIVAATPGGTPNVQDIYPLAPLQEGILFQHLVTTQGDPYLAPFLLGFDSRTRLDSFLSVLQTLVQRHDVLRTAVVWKNVEAPLQVVLRQVEVPVEELTSHTSAEQLLTRFDPRTYRLDLSKAPLLRAIVAHGQDSGQWLLLLLTHHLILDHTSMEIVVHELQMLMADAQAALPVALPYRNFIAQTRAGATQQEHESFFTRLLGDVDEPTAPFGLLDIQSDFAQTAEGRLLLEDDLSRRIREQARTLGVTPASLFHLAWAAVLAAVTGKSDVVFGTVLFGRMRSGAGADRVVGMFINTLPIRLTVDAAGVKQSVIHTHQVLAELMAHEHAPLALAQRCSRVPAPAPLFSSLFNYRHNVAREGEAEWPGVEMLNSAERTNYPLAMAVDDSGSSFTLRALAHPTAGAERVCRYLQEALIGLLDSLDHAPETPLQTLRVLPPAERRLVVEEWNRTEATFENGTLHGLFSAQARRTPDAVAVVGLDGQELSYAELDARSTRLAQQLVGRGVRLESVVGVRLERSTETIVALLAILKAGGVYLPLDPAYPPDRLAYMTADAGAILVLDSVHGLEDEGELPQLADPKRLAYIIYTSGTSGLPKGVAVPHEAPVNMAFARRACHDPIGPGDRVLAAISVGFDVSIGQLLLPLLSGATVIIAGDLKTLGAVEFWALLERQKVTHLNSVPSFLDSILDALPPTHRIALKRLMLGGEPLSGTLVARLQRALPGLEVVNMYGPTEACIDATFHVASPADSSLAVLPIGRPLPNYRAYILDRGLEPVGVGVVGELYLSGLGLARGYVNAPELTAERFLADPFSATPGARMYRTGDRACWRADGCIEFLGRVDQQVKIRGFRVEPGEVEAQLRQLPGIREAAVIAHLDGSGSRLVAYYSGDEAPPIETMRAALAAVLPEYMVPSAFVKLDKLPLSANGKLDRKALPEPGTNAFIARVYEPPQGEVEERMAALWAEVLQRDKVGRHDNFFELGGDSLRATRVVNLLNDRFKVTVPLRALFEYPTIGALAVAIDTSSYLGRSGHLVPLQPAGAKPKLFVVHPAGGHVFCYLPLVRELGIDQPVFGLQAGGLEEAEPLPSSIEQMASDYVEAIRQVQPRGPYHLLGMSSGGLIAFEMARQIKASGDELRLLALLDTTVPGSLTESVFSETSLLRAMAAELNCLDLLSQDLLTESSPAPALEQLVEMGRNSGRLPAEFTLALAQRVAAVFQNTVRMHSAYLPASWDGPMLLVRALRRLRAGDSVPDWSPHVTGQLEIFDFDCGHADLVSNAFAAQMAALIATHLRRSPT